MPLPLPQKFSYRFAPLLSILAVALILFTVFYGSSNAPTAAVHLHAGVDDYRRLFLSLSTDANASIASHLRSLTAIPHLAGTLAAASPAAYVLSHLRQYGVDEAVSVEFFPLLSYPVSSSLSLLRASDLSVIKSLDLAEPAASAYPGVDIVPPYHAYSPSGNVLAPAVYVNFGREEDYDTLRRLGVDIKGFVAMVRRGGGSRGEVVARAAEKGATAVLMFKVGDGGGIERGTVLLGGVGDPLTPGWAATAGAERLSFVEDEVRRRFPKIPSMPVAEAVALEILSTLGGPHMPDDWEGKVQFGADAGVGPGPVLVNFTYKVNSLNCLTEL